jgi:hypothetical protein
MFTKSIPLIFLLASATTAFGGIGIPLPWSPIEPITTTTETTTETTSTRTKNDPSLFLGFSWTLGGPGSGGGTPGLTLKILSTNKRDAVAAAAGVTYNFDGTFGCDAGLGYNTRAASMTVGYDFCKRGLQFGLGGTQKPKSVTTTTTTTTTTETTSGGGPIFIGGM